MNENKNTPRGNNQNGNNQRRRHHNPNNRPGGTGGPNQNSNNNNNHRRRFHRPMHKGNRPQQAPGVNLDRVYEKYQNLLEQHLIARRKYFELYFRADPQQKAKLDRHFNQSLIDLREFEKRLTPETKVLFEQKNNGLALDEIYSVNHELKAEEKNGIVEILDEKIADPHFLMSQSAADFSGDTEESVGTLEDYQRYKGH